MKKYILFFAVLFAATVAKAYDIDYAGCYKSFKLEYQSVDENNEPITLSELVTIPLEKDGVTNREVGFFVLSAMPFPFTQELAATGDKPFDALVLRSIATEGAMTVQVDGQGLGSSDGKTVIALTSKLSARQSIDGLFAAMDYAQKNGIKISDNYYTINSGYSFAGGVAIAVQRYLEKNSTAEEKARFRLKQTICGGAAINSTATIKYLLESGTNKDFFVYLDGFCKAHAHGSLHGVNWEDIRDEKGDLPSDLLDDDSALGRAFKKALSEEDMDNDWIPEIPIRYIHFPNDYSVPYENAEIALNAWGKDKLQLVSRDMAGMKWNFSFMHPLNEYVLRASKVSTHIAGAIDFYSGMIDGCLRDTVVVSTYCKAMNFKDILTAVFDMSSGFTQDIPVNFSASLNKSTLTIKSLGYLHFSGEIVDSTKNDTTTIDVTVKPEVKDSLASLIKTVDAKGYLHLPIDFNVNISIKGTKIPVTGSCQDLYKLVENLTACLMHHKCATKEEAEKYCNAINSTLDLNVTYSSLSGKVIAWYMLSSDKSCYLIEPHLNAFGMKMTIDQIQPFLTLAKVKVNIRDYLTIDNKAFKMFGKKVMFHVTDDLVNEQKFYADILNEDSTLYGRADFDVTGVDLNEDGTCQTVKVGFTAYLNDIPAKITGTCQNLNDALLSAILCFGNLSCSTEEQAQAYADVVNNNMDMEFYIAQVGEDGKYPENPTYTDYGPVKAVVAQDAFGAYYAQYVLNWMGNYNMPLTTVIDEIFK